ncbi:MAG: helix-turn-helix transcriptional regulator [Opitutaceae bacterium]
MNRTDRLVAIVMFMQGRRLARAEELAEHFEVSVRTVYRDIHALCEAGVPVAGEAGVGYSLMKGYHLPPVMFTTEEAMALFVGGEMVKNFTDASLASPMLTALLKIRSVLPPEHQDDVDRLARSTVFQGRSSAPDRLDNRVLLPIQHGIVARKVLRLAYRAAGPAGETRRDVEPLGVTFTHGSWYLVAWCRLREDYRHFKLERVRQLEVLDERFAVRVDFSLRKHLDDNLAQADLFPARVWFSRNGIERARRECCANLGEETPAADGVSVSMKTFSYPWLARWILSFGGEAEAEEPGELRLLVEESAKKALTAHRKKHS